MSVTPPEVTAADREACYLAHPPLCPVCLQNALATVRAEGCSAAYHLTMLTHIERDEKLLAEALARVTTLEAALREIACGTKAWTRGEMIDVAVKALAPGAL